MKKKWAAYIAGDENIFFPALVSLVSLEEYNPGTFDRFIIFNGECKTDEMDALLAQYNITFIDTKSITLGNISDPLPSMRDGRWPAEIHMNWALPEHLHNLGYTYSLKLDYDTLSLSKFPTHEFESQPFSVAALPVASSTFIPDTAVVKVQHSMGIKTSRAQAYNEGVVVFDNAYAAKFSFFGRYYRLYKLLMNEGVSEHNVTLERLCFAALVANMENVRSLSRQLHVRVLAIQDVKPDSHQMLLFYISSLLINHGTHSHLNKLFT